MTEVDAGANDTDAGTMEVVDSGFDEPDAGSPDAGPLILVITSDARAVHLQWEGGASDDGGWLVVRDGETVAVLPVTTRTFDDLDAGEGALTTFDASATVDLPDGIELEWATPTSAPGAVHAYVVRASSGATSNEVLAGCAAPELAGFRIERDDAGWLVDAGVSVWLDQTVASPTVFAGELMATARVDDRTTSVVLTATSDAGRVLVPVSYAVVALASTGAESKIEIIGTRGGNRVEYQWQRSAADDPSGFIDLPYVHGLTWLDQDAVLSEGRFYRLQASAAGQQWVSPPVRAELRRPIALGHVGPFSYPELPWVLRDDWVAVRVQDGRTVQFPPIRDFSLCLSGPCGITLDGGILVGPDDVSLGYPPVRSIKVWDRAMWLNFEDGTVQRHYPLSVQTSSLADVTSLLAVNDSDACGALVDGGVQCISTFVRPSFPVTLTRPLGVWAGYSAVFASDEWGNVRAFGAPSVSRLPQEDAGYIGGQEDLGVECAVRVDGFVRCVDVQDFRAFAPPVSPEPYRAFVWQTIAFRCALTTDDRVRCYLENAPHVPPKPPVAALQTHNDEIVALLENGRIDARRRVYPVLKESFDDRFVSLSRDWISYQRPGLVQCGLRADGVARCGGMSVRANSRYSQITSRAGLSIDGGVENWLDGGSLWAGESVVELSEHIEPSIICAHFADGGWACDPQLPIPAEPFSMIALSGSRGCGLTSRGKLHCWPEATPEVLERHRFRHVSLRRNLCATTLEGEVLCAVDGGVSAPLPWDDFTTFEDSNLGCGLRRDRNVGCRNSSNFGVDPWRP